MRNWPYAYARGGHAGKGSRIRDDFAVAPLPAFGDAGRAGVLGGHNLVISAYSRSPEARVALIRYLTSPEVMEARTLPSTRFAPALSRHV